MFLQRSSCILCGEHIPKIKYNLKTTYSETSNILLIKFVEKLYKNVFLMHCNICSSCYDLLNELDLIQTREKELYTKLGNYISKAQGLTLELNENINSADKVKEEVSSDDDVPKIENIDLKKLPIKVKRISSDVASDVPKNDEIFKSPGSKPNSHFKNQEAFEKIQSSIQMDLSKHVQDHVNKYKPSKDVLCEVCGQNFKTKSGYENHIKKHDDAEDTLNILVMNKKDEENICNICGKVFCQKGALSRHLFIHSGQTRYQCEECGKKFVHNSSFNMHKKIHAGLRNFKCDECNKGFLSRSHLKRHLRAAHSGLKNHCCEYCGKKFAENYNLIAHVKVVHGQQEEILYVTSEDNVNVFF